MSTLDRFAMPPILVAIAHGLGVPLAEIVRPAGAYFLIYGLSQPVWGLVSDRLGRVRTMRGAMFLAGLFALASALAWSPFAPAVARGLAGGAFGAAYPSGLIYLGDTVPMAGPPSRVPATALPPRAPRRASTGSLSSCSPISWPGSHSAGTRRS